jgi:hypothetical protein
MAQCLNSAKMEEAHSINQEIGMVRVALGTMRTTGRPRQNFVAPVAPDLRPQSDPRAARSRPLPRLAPHRAPWRARSRPIAPFVTGVVAARTFMDDAGRQSGTR